MGLAEGWDWSSCRSLKAEHYLRICCNFESRRGFPTPQRRKAPQGRSDTDSSFRQPPRPEPAGARTAPGEGRGLCPWGGCPAAPRQASAPSHAPPGARSSGRAGSIRRGAAGSARRTAAGPGRAGSEPPTSATAGPRAPPRTEAPQPGPHAPSVSTPRLQ